ncbi:MAG: hypothetical protein PF693_01845 [Spirochaetia bacterium]|nr:hypothetical protein [Spirochaetia bacterium]
MIITLKRYSGILIFLLVFLFNLNAADLEIPKMELITRSDIGPSTPILVTRGKIDLKIGGGYKLGGSLILGFDSADLGYSDTELDPATEDASSLATYLNNQTYLQFQSAQVTIRDLFSTPTEFTYFTGELDVLCSGDDFPYLFGSVPVATRYRGYLYFPDDEFDGIHTINGTGLKLSSTFGSERILTSAFIYEDGYLGNGHFSGDIRTLFNFDKIRMESFVGATFPASTFGLYRGGLLFHYNPGTTGEFFAQIGVPQWDPSMSFTIERLFFLFEPRIKINPVTIILTLFWHPGYYLQTATAEMGSADVHLNFMLGEPETSTFSGGLEGSVTFDSSAVSNKFGVNVSPYISAITSGVIWNIMLNTELFPYSLNDMFEGVISVKAEF